MRAFLVLAALAPLASCVQLSWSRDTRYEPLPAAALARLEPRGTDLAQCLADFGAPLWVWEQPGDGAALAWGWYDERGFGLHLSVPVTHDTSASLAYDQDGARMRGVVLFFDARWKLVSWRQGLLRDLTRELRRPPASPEDA
jgi:hypothetical protein